MAKTKSTPPLPRPAALRTDGEGAKSYPVLVWGEGDTHTRYQHDAPHDLLVVIDGKSYAHVAEDPTGIWIYRRDAK